MYFYQKTENIKKQQVNNISDVKKMEDNDMENVDKFVSEMIKEAIKDEKKDALFYVELAEKISDENDKKIIHKIHNDEKKHEKIFKEIYMLINGEEPDENELQFEKKQLSTNMLQNFSDAIFDELDAVEFYRKIYFSFLNQEIRDALYEIITDEQIHAQILNYMYAKYLN